MKKPKFQKLGAESEKRVINKSVVYQIITSSIILSLIALFELLVHMPSVFSGDKSSIVAAISGISVIIGVSGTIRRLKWGLYFLGFSIVFPIIFMPFFDIGLLCKVSQAFILLATLHLMLAYRVCNCENQGAKDRLLKFSKIYFHIMLIIVLSSLLAIFFAILSCAYEGSKARGESGSIRWDDVRIQIQKSDILGAFYLAR